MPSSDPVIKKLQGQRYRETHREQVRAYQRGRKRNRYAYQKAWFAAHPEKHAAYDLKHRQWHQEELAERKRQYYMKNRAREIAKRRAYYRANKEAYLEACKRYAKLHPEVRRAANRKYYYKDLEASRKKSRDSARRRYPQKRKEIIAREIVRGAARRSLIQLGSKEDRKQAVSLILGLRANPETRCAYCDILLLGKRVHIDHILPLSRGGRHCVENLCASCETCNISKGDRTPEEWREAMKGAI